MTCAKCAEWSALVNAPPDGFQEHGHFISPDGRCKVTIGIGTNCGIYTYCERCKSKDCKMCTIILKNIGRRPSDGLDFDPEPYLHALHVANYAFAGYNKH
jgi:hypothetical protein